MRGSQDFDTTRPDANSYSSITVLAIIVENSLQGSAKTQLSNAKHITGRSVGDTLIAAFHSAIITYLLSCIFCVFASRLTTGWTNQPLSIV